MKICNHEMNITALEPTILLFLDINAGILIDGENCKKNDFLAVLPTSCTHTHRGLYYFQRLSFFIKADIYDN